MIALLLYFRLNPIIAVPAGLFLDLGLAHLIANTIRHYGG